MDTSALLWIVGGGLLMSIIALSGALLLLLPAHTLQATIMPLVAFAAGSLLGGAFLHMLPEAFEHQGGTAPLLWTLAGFVSFFLIEQGLHWHHCHRSDMPCRGTFSYLVLIGDALHNLVGGLAVGAAFLVDTRLGITLWLVAAAHEVPQEFGDFAVLIHGGMSRARALALNFASALTFLLGGLLAYAGAQHLDVSFLLPFAAGNFIYVGASDLIPEVQKHGGTKKGLVHLGALIAGMALMAVIRIGFHGAQ